jgi:Dolichyl-phosphate-mannose-protein mannosyltransferase
MADSSAPSARLPFGWLALIVTVGLGLRLLPVLSYGQQPGLFMTYDSWGYHRLASNLLQGNGYSWDLQPPYTPNLYRPPVLPVLLLGLYAVTGESIVAAIVLQALVSTATIVLTFFLVRGLNFSRGTALAAAAILAFDPVAIQYSNLLLTEVYTSLLLLLVAGSVLVYSRSARPVWLVTAGGLLGVGIILHPILLFLPILLLLAPLLTRTTRTLRHFGIAAAALVLALTPAAAWIVRNWYVGDFVGISSVSAVNMLKYKAAGVEAELRGTSRDIERDRLTRACEAELPANATAGERYRLWEHRGREILLAHPLTYAKVHLQGMLVELIGPERDHTTRMLYGKAAMNRAGSYDDESVAAARTISPVTALEAARHGILCWQAFLLVCLACGTWQLVRQRTWLLVALLLIPLYVLALTGGPEASPRFRVIYLPVFALLTAVGFQAVLHLRLPRLAREQVPQSLRASPTAA